MSGPSVGRTQIVKAAPTTAPERATNCGGGGGGKGGVAGGDGGAAVALDGGGNSGVGRSRSG